MGVSIEKQVENENKRRQKLVSKVKAKMDTLKAKIKADRIVLGNLESYYYSLASQAERKSVNEKS